MRICMYARARARACVTVCARLHLCARARACVHACARARSHLRTRVPARARMRTCARALRRRVRSGRVQGVMGVRAGPRSGRAGSARNLMARACAAVCGLRAAHVGSGRAAAGLILLCRFFADRLRICCSFGEVPPASSFPRRPPRRPLAPTCRAVRVRERRRRPSAGGPAPKVDQPIGSPGSQTARRAAVLPAGRAIAAAPPPSACRDRRSTPQQTAAAAASKLRQATVVSHTGRLPLFRARPAGRACRRLAGQPRDQCARRCTASGSVFWLFV